MKELITANCAFCYDIKMPGFLRTNIGGEYLIIIIVNIGGEYLISESGSTVQASLRK